MDDVSRLFGLSFCMFVGCYVAGAIPLAFTMSEVSFKNAIDPGISMVFYSVISVVSVSIVLVKKL